MTSEQRPSSWHSNNKLLSAVEQSQNEWDAIDQALREKNVRVLVATKALTAPTPCLTLWSLESDYRHCASKEIFTLKGAIPALVRASTQDWFGMVINTTMIYTPVLKK